MRDNLFFGSFIGSNCLLLPKIARAEDASTASSLFYYPANYLPHTVFVNVNMCYDLSISKKVLILHLINIVFHFAASNVHNPEGAWFMFGRMWMEMWNWWVTCFCETGEKTWIHQWGCQILCHCQMSSHVRAASWRTEILWCEFNLLNFWYWKRFMQLQLLFSFMNFQRYKCLSVSMTIQAVVILFCSMFE